MVQTIDPRLLTATGCRVIRGAPGGTRTLTRRLASKTSVSTNSTTGAIYHLVVAQFTILLLPNVYKSMTVRY